MARLAFMLHRMRVFKTFQSRKCHSSLSLKAKVPVLFSVCPYCAGISLQVMASNAANWWKRKTDRNPPKALAQCILWMKTDFQTVSQSPSLLFLQLGLRDTILKHFQLTQSKRDSHLHIFIKAIYCRLAWQPFTKSAPTKVLNRIKNKSYGDISAKTCKNKNSREPDVYSVPHHSLPTYTPKFSEVLKPWTVPQYNRVCMFPII